MLDIKHLAEAGSRHGNLTDVADPPLALNANKTILNDVLNAQADLPFPLVPNYFTPGWWKSFQGYDYAKKRIRQKGYDKKPEAAATAW